MSLKTLFLLLNLILVVMLNPCPAMARYNRSYLSTTIKYTHYADVRASTTATTSIVPSYDVEVDLRVKSFFQFMFVVSKTTDNLRQYNGAGMRVDTPGFFGMTTAARQYVIQKKNYPINTSVFAYLFGAQVKSSANVEAERAAGSNIGISLDIFLYNPSLYLTLEGSFMNTTGNTYGTHSLGFGWEF